MEQLKANILTNAKRKYSKNWKEQSNILCRPWGAFEAFM